MIMNDHVLTQSRHYGRISQMYGTNHTSHHCGVAAIIQIIDFTNIALISQGGDDIWPITAHNIVEGDSHSYSCALAGTCNIVGAYLVNNRALITFLYLHPRSHTSK